MFYDRLGQFYDTLGGQGPWYEIRELEHCDHYSDYNQDIAIITHIIINILQSLLILKLEYCNQYSDYSWEIAIIAHIIINILTSSALASKVHFSLRNIYLSFLYHGVRTSKETNIITLKLKQKELHLSHKIFSWIDSFKWFADFPTRHPSPHIDFNIMWKTWSFGIIDIFSISLENPNWSVWSAWPALACCRQNVVDTINGFFFFFFFFLFFFPIQLLFSQKGLSQGSEILHRVLTYIWDQPYFI